MTSTAQLEILDLRHYSANQLRPVLEQESRAWNELLLWDYRTSADLLLRYLDSRILPGYVALDRGVVSGYIFCVYEQSKAIIGDVYAAPVRPPEPSYRSFSSGSSEFTPAVEVENRLLDFTIELLQNSPGVDRIESQLLLHPHDSHRAVFDRNGFTTVERLFMELDLTQYVPAAQARAVALPDGMILRRWQESDFAAAGRLIAAAYEGHLDAQINDQYRSVAGSLHFLHNIVRFPGCGVFDASASFVLVCADTQEFAGVLLCSRVREDVYHLTQICIAEIYRAHGLATLMMEHCATELRSRSIKVLTLTVTARNTNAISLYCKQGFRSTHAFDAMVWERRDENRSWKSILG